MKKIIEAIIEVFPEADTTNIDVDTILQDLPGLDSMSAINLRIEIESRYRSSGLSIEFGLRQTLGELCDELRKKGVEL